MVPGDIGGGPSVLPKDTIRTVLSIAVNAGGLLAGGAIGGVFGSVAGAAISFAGLLGVNALIPPADAPVEQFGFNITGTRNRLVPGSPVPVLFGKHRIYPMLAARASTESTGTDNYLRLLYLLPYGPLEVSELKIGDSPISSFDDVQYEIRRGDSHLPDSRDQPITLFTDVISEEGVNVDITNANTNGDTEGVPNEIIRTTQENVDEISITIAFLEGLYREQNGHHAWPVVFNVFYRLVGTTEWRIVPQLEFSSVATVANTVDNDETFVWLDTANGLMQDFIDGITPFVLGAREMVDTVLSFFDGLLTEIQGFLPNMNVQNGGQQATVDTTTAVLSDAQDIIDTFTGVADVSLVTPAVQVIVDVGLAAFEIAQLIQEVNNYVAMGRGPDLASFPEWMQILINNQGLAPIFTPAGTNDITITSNKTVPVRNDIRWKVKRAGQYEVRVVRVSQDWTANHIRADSRWTVLRSIQVKDPVNLPGVGLVAMRIKATDQLAGVIDSFNLIASRLVRTWDGAVFTDPIESSNPAWQLLELWTGHQNERPLADTRVDVDALKAWADDNDTDGYACDIVINRKQTIFRTSKMICATAKASPGVVDGIFTVVRDKPTLPLIQHFTPRNSWGFQSQHNAMETPHALRITFIDAEAGYQEAVRYVYRDGFSSDGAGGTTVATLIEHMEIPGITSADLAWRLGRYHIAVFELRRETVEINTGLEHIACTRGDLVRVQHFVNLWGLQSARIKSIIHDDPTPAFAIGVIVDDPFIVEETNYDLRIRLKSGISEVHQLIPPTAGRTTTLLFQTPIAVPESFEPLDLVMFGRTGTETVELIVHEVIPTNENNARLVLIERAPDVHTSDTGIIPDYNAQITIPPEEEVIAPSPPILDQVITDERALVRRAGTLESRILVTILPIGAETTPAPVKSIQAQFRLIVPDEPNSQQGGRAGWIGMGLFPEDSTAISIGPVEDELIYDIRVRNVTEGGVTSTWSTIKNITVIGKTTPPPDIGEIWYEGGIIRWSYKNPPNDFAGFEVRWATGDLVIWETAAPVQGSVITQTYIDLIVVGTGTITVLVKAVDTTGNVSVNAASVVRGVGDEPIDNIVFTRSDFPTWPAVIVGGTIDVGDDFIKADDSSEGFWVDDNQEFWSVDGNEFWSPSGSFKILQYRVEPFHPDPLLLPAFIDLSADVIADSWQIEYRRPSDAPIWPLDLDDDYWPTDLDDDLWDNSFSWLPWVSQIEAEDIDYGFRIFVRTGSQQGIIKEFTIIVDAKDVIENQEDVVIAIGGTRTVPVKTFKKIVAVFGTIQTTSGATTLEVVDKNPTLGPLVICRDAAGVDVGGTVDLSYQGF
jgi:hypothetical protein